MVYDRPLYDLDEKMDLDPKNYKAWILGTEWYPPPWCPLFVDYHFSYGKYGMQFAPEKLSDPRTKGWDMRMYKGGFYLSIIQTTEEERKKREQPWREKIRTILEDPWALWERYKLELRERFDKIFAVDLPMLADIDLCDHFLEVWHLGKLVHEAHFIGMYGLGQGNILFRRVLKQLFDISPADVKYSELHSGFENEFTAVAEKLAKVAALAIDLGLEQIFKDSKIEELLARLEGDEKGKQWIKKFQELVRDYGWIRRNEILTPTWWEDNTLPLIEIKRYVEQGKGTASYTEMRPQLEKRRKEVEQELLNRVPKEERETFQRLLACSQASHVFSEEHTMYVEMKGFTAVRLAAVEFGRRFTEKGILDSTDDIFFLHHEEILHSGIIQERCDLRSLVEKRKQERNDYRKLEGTLPFVLGDASKLQELVDADVAFSVSAAPPIARPEDVGASLVGCAGAPGVVEGIACVVAGEEEMDKVESGTILVAPSTMASWAPLFNVIKGVITDGGGYLAHALILSREFGIPAVVGTQEATKKIKTGQRVRVDGNQCRVYILG